jgi:hypothetical protein
MHTIKVHYIHTVLGGPRGGDSYWVSRAFADRAGAEEFISVNALVHPLPGPAWIEDPNPPALPVQPDLHTCYLGPVCAVGPQLSEHDVPCGHGSCEIAVNDACDACLDWQTPYPPWMTCPRHGYVRIIEALSGSSAGFAGGRITHIQLECGCSEHDESDDVRAAL